MFGKDIRQFSEMSRLMRLAVELLDYLQNDSNKFRSVVFIDFIDKL